jgi:hypothetical protein
VPNRSALDDLAMLAGAMPIGDPPQYLFTIDQLAALVDLVGGDEQLIALHDRLQEKGVVVALLC